MCRKPIVPVLVSALLISLVVLPTFAKTKEEKDAELAAKVKTEIAKLGTGPEARIEVKLRDKTKLKGYISKVGEESFVIADAKTGVETEMAYPNVTQAKGKHLTKGQWIAIGVTAAVLIGIIVFLNWYEYNS
ncbi:MAG: hypothetical protein JNM09_03510 [Blastocatellia bacterium]|nr:hypothetical protein [Blastocatellia bacterium]